MGLTLKDLIGRLELTDLDLLNWAKSWEDFLDLSTCETGDKDACEVGARLYLDIARGHLRHTIEKLTTLDEEFEKCMKNM